MDKKPRRPRVMFYGAYPKIFGRAKQLRATMTVAEQELWKRLSKRQLGDVRFKPQHPLSHFIADFYCHKAKLVVEVDGGIHNHPENIERDALRDKTMEAMGIKVLRFTNEEVLYRMEDVLREILREIQERVITPQSPKGDDSESPLGDSDSPEGEP